VNLIDRTLAWLADPVHWGGPNGIPTRLGEHIAISGFSLVIAIAVAFPVGLWIGHTGRGAAVAVNLANLWRALPSLAVIAIALPITAGIDPQAGFKFYPTVIAMIVLGIPPILVNTFSGIQGVERDLVEAGRGQGMSERQVLTKVELPLAVPVVLSGISSAAIQIVATATLGAVFGFGGLGRYLVDGLSQGDAGQTVGGAVLVGALVIAAGGLFVLIERLAAPRPSRRNAFIFRV
jgi:osmoprotectant transport system permease protein